MTILNKCVFCRSPEMFICECEEAMAGCSTFWAECEACGARGPISEYKDGATISWNAILASPEPTEGLREALTLAEAVLSRAPFSTQIWPNGMHPNEGIALIRAALRAMPLQDHAVTQDKRHD